ncbi:Succinyl-diaminopimelate desuccinylase [Arthrobacter saudimassiliensis]|uniref:Succinyl-diaminopimelate desuccinylase n=1 Tax=Arthrobacter saudimassiliensis TaxID=1461584 RepID=A0A078MMR6_9MICC|nr:Succinyl-diaminopimelate desuccinylase [Arthrobacter saudimassiliensis]
MTATRHALSRLDGLVADGFPAAVEALARLVAIPGLAWPGADPAALERSAELTAELLRSAGFRDVAVDRAPRPDGAPGAPAVLARRPAAPGFPTVLLYAHHDVQPSGDPGAWASPPFRATERNGRLYGRGVADDKAGIILHAAACRALLDLTGPAAGLGITVLVEGEEEIGSPSLPALLDRHTDLEAADVAIVADSGNWRVGVPALTTSLRGLVDGTIELRALEHGLHSGTYGGPVLDALTLMGRLVATFHDEAGNLTVAGLEHGDEPAVDLDEDMFRADAGLPDGVRLAGGGSLTGRLWSRPALALTGMDVPAVDAAANTLLPSVRVKFSLRIPPGTEPDDAMAAMQRHVARHAPFGAETVFTPGTGSRPFAVDPADPAVEAAVEAMRSAWGVEPVLMGVGGSIPAASLLAGRNPALSVLITGAEDPDTRAHGADESLDLTDLRQGILAEAALLARLSGLLGKEPAPAPASMHP